MEAAFDGDLAEVKNYLDKGMLSKFILIMIIIVMHCQVLLLCTKDVTFTVLLFCCDGRLSFGVSRWAQTHSPFRSRLSGTHRSHHSFTPGELLHTVAKAWMHKHTFWPTIVIFCLVFSFSFLLNRLAPIQTVQVTRAEVHCGAQPLTDMCRYCSLIALQSPYVFFL